MKTTGKSFLYSSQTKVLQSLLFGNSGAKGVSPEMDGLHEVLDQRLSDFLKITLPACGLCCNLKHCHTFCQIF